jgi:hypothetical protein
MTTKKKHRWAILPPAAAEESGTSRDDVTQTRRLLQTGEDGDKAPDAAVSRRRARTEPELPLDVLAQQVAPSTPIPQRVGPAREHTDPKAPSREAATVPPDASPTIASPKANSGGPGPVPTLIDLSPPDDGQDVTIVERSATTALGPGATLPGATLPGATLPGATLPSPAPSEHGETLPSPPRRDDDD